MLWTWRRLQEAKRLVKPLQRLLVELAKGASAGHDQALFRCFSPQVLRFVERGLIRAMARCVVAELGSYESIDGRSVVITRSIGKNGERLHTADAKAKFTKMDDVSVTATWAVAPPLGSREKSAADAPESSEVAAAASGLAAGRALGDGLILSFQVKPPEGKQLEVLKYIDPKEFEHFGERFLLSLMTKTPTYAYEHMNDTLKQKYPSEQLVASEILKVLRAAGGLKDKNEVASQLTDARLVHHNSEDGSPTAISGMELEFMILGRTKNIVALIRTNFVAMQCRVSRFTMRTVTTETTQHVVVDGDTNEVVHSQ